ncbi:TIGR01244 family phosphatase [Altererythrobacter sp. SALINAS58]|uniref:TIGR01244 family sulfur transferase n=1 Tax=Alteripontixanthobacter muriae TaxID=2705546 RepID=UPI00157542FB|nr:TIGR01244 family sulfur transferase [Alteripontixanthobacter muriae]NTZ42676.1 TIGR01244 family phosphatase [Alteripontixanthobacter muriae]
MSEHKRLSDRLTVRPQIQTDEIAGIAAAGFKGIINNRPDKEEPDQPSSSDLKAEAERHGLNYWHIPVVPGQANGTHVEAFAEALNHSDGPVMAFCKTGNRAAGLWEASQRKNED